MSTPKQDTSLAGDRVLAVSGEEKAGIAAIVLAAVFVGSLGLAASFQAVSQAAARWGFTSPWMLPVAIDIAIPVFSCVHLFLIRFDMALAWVRAVPWALTAVTVYLNWSAGRSFPARVGHGALPLLWVVLSEVAAHVYRVRIGQATGKRLERIRRSRWLLAPVSTGRLWRRMVLWEETSYTVALGRERDRLLALADLRERHGVGWRWRAPRRERVLLRLGALAPSTVSATVERAASALVGDSEEPAQALAQISSERARETADERAQTPASSNVRSRVSAAKKAAKHHKVSASKNVNERRAERVRALYDELGKRPEWTDIRDALTAANLSVHPVSRPTAQRIRERVEKKEPALAALGSTTVHPLTGTDS